MALSGFIKQLLQTDTVFGSEAKKVTGINDSIVRQAYPNASFTFNISNGILSFVLYNYDITVAAPQWMVNGKYVKFFFADALVPTVDYSRLELYEDKLLQIDTVTIDETENQLIITFIPDVEGTPPVNTFPTIGDITDVNFLIDGRIFALIGDVSIAREASNGSTMFNLDNVDSTGVDVDASGLAKKYASHYHTDLFAEITVHEKDDSGNNLARITVDTASGSQNIIYDEDEAVQLYRDGIVDATNTNITFTFGETTREVARFGQPSTPLKGIFAKIDGGTLPAGGTSEATDIDITQVQTNPLSIGLVPSQQFEYPAAVIEIRAADDSFRCYADIVGAGSTANFVDIDITSGDTPEPGDKIVVIYSDGDAFDSDGIFFNNVLFVINLDRNEQSSGVIRWEVPRDANTIEASARQALLNLAALCNNFFGQEYIFDTVDDSSTKFQEVTYEARVAGTAANLEPIILENHDGQHNLIFDPDDVTLGTNGVPVSGTEFITKGDLIRVLRQNDLGFTIEDEGTPISIGTDRNGSRSFSINIPSTGTPRRFSIAIGSVGTGSNSSRFIWPSSIFQTRTQHDFWWISGDLGGQRIGFQDDVNVNRQYRNFDVVRDIFPTPVLMAHAIANEIVNGKDVDYDEPNENQNGQQWAWNATAEGDVITFTRGDGEDVTGLPTFFGTTNNNNLQCTIEDIPSSVPNFFQNEDTPLGITDLEVSNGTFRISDSHPDIVIDESGDVVFNFPVIKIGAL